MLVRSHEAPAHQNGYKPRLAAAVNPFYWAERASEGRFWVTMLVLPAILVIAVIVLYPTLYGIGLSVREMRLTRPDLGTGFVGLKHYAALISDPVFWTAIRNTAVWVAASVGAEVALGLVSALVLNRPLPGLKAAAVLVLIPWFLPNVVAGNMWALLLDARLGVLNDIGVRVGILDSYKAWFADPATALAAAILVEAWHGFPFFTLLFMAALKGIPEELNEAAYVDGAGLRQRLRFVTLPMLKPIIVVSVILRVIGLVNSPELLLILTGGGPGHATMVLSLYAFETAYRAFDFGYSGALSVVALCLLMFFAYIYVRATNVVRDT